jgi:hypothetical protein
MGGDQEDCVKGGIDEFANWWDRHVYAVKYAPILQQNIRTECKFRFREWDDKWEKQVLSDANLNWILVDVEICEVYTI